MNRNSVIFKGIQNGILIILDNTILFEELEQLFLDKVKNAKPFFEGANISITFKGRDLSEDEELRLLEIIAKESGLELSFVNNMPTIKNCEQDTETEIETEIEPQREEDLKQNVDIMQNMMQIQNHILTTKTNITHFHKGSIRSGQEITFAGSVVVIGDINPGGKILAEGNVIVLGKLKGVVHAGCKGDKECFISAIYLNPSQLIIGDCLAYFPNDIEREMVPEYVYVRENQIFVEPLLKS